MLLEDKENEKKDSVISKVQNFLKFVRHMLSSCIPGDVLNNLEKNAIYEPSEEILRPYLIVF